MSDETKKIKELEIEINYLHQLLEDNHISYKKNYNKITDSKTAVKEDQGKLIIGREISEDMVKFFYSYFRGRNDVYSKRIQTKSGKVGYFPVCNNFWKYGICPRTNGKKIKCQDCVEKDYKKLSISALLSHLKGTKTDCSDVIGVYPLLPDNTCNFLVFDFDNHEGTTDNNTENQLGEDYLKEVNALRTICQINNIDALIERSRSGHGAHVWLFFEQPISAVKARKFGAALLTKGSQSVNLEDFKSYDRMIPVQNTLPEGKIGNLIALPLQGQALKNGNSAFVDADWNALPDQWHALVNTKKLSLNFIDEKIKEWSIDGNELGQLEEEETETKPLSLLSSNPWDREEKQFHNEDAEGKVKLVISNGIYIEKKNLAARLQNQIRRLAAYSNPEFYKKLAIGFSTYNVPRIVYCGTDDDNYICLPRGCYEELVYLLNSAKIDYEIKDKRQYGKPIAVTFKGTLYPEQKTAVDRILQNDIGILSAATAFGKTVVGAYLVASRKTNALILVRSIEIMKNWQEDLKQFLQIDELIPVRKTASGRSKKLKSIIGSFQAKNDCLTGIVDVAMIQSLGKRDEVNKIVKDYGLVIMDECHHAGAETDEEILREISARYVYGLTATPKRSDGQEKKIIMQLGPIRYRYTAKQRAIKQGIKHFVYPRFTRLVNPSGEKLSIIEFNDLIINSKIRNAQIVQDVVQCIKEKRTPVVLTKSRKHANYLYESLKNKADQVFLFLGEMKGKDRDVLRQKMKSVPEEESLIIIATGSIIGEGFNYPRLDALFIAMPISWEGSVEQYAGRLNRDYAKKSEVIIYDYIDAHIPTLERMYHKRLNAYKKIGFEVYSETVNYQLTSNVIFDYLSYQIIFENDLASANKEIVISSPGLSKNKINHLIPLLASRQHAGVKIIVFTLPSDSYTQNYRKNAEDNINNLLSAGIVVRVNRNYHEHFAIIDRKICWYGSMNLLSKPKEDDNLMRIVNNEMSNELLEIVTNVSQ